MRVATIHLAPGTRLPTRPVDAVEAEAGKDLAAEQLGYPFDPGSTRRNITVDAGDIPTAPGARLRIGEVELEVVRVAAPCRLMEEAVGPGATAALRGRAGSACRVLTSGSIRVGDPVDLLDR